MAGAMTTGGAWDGGQEASASDKTWSLTTRPPHAKILSSARSILGRDLEILGRSAMESSSEEELEEDFPGHEWITPQFSICAAYQSQTEKGIRKFCSELLELKDAIENLCGNMQSKYHAFLRWHRSALTNTWCRMLASSSFRSVYAHAEVPPAHAPA